MYIVQQGRVEIFLVNADNERIVLGHVEEGDLFGEFSLLDNEPRSASALATENTDLVLVDQNDLHSLIRAHPAAALDMMAILTKRIREANYRVQERGIRNINEEIEEKGLSLGERVADFLTTVASNIYFAYLNFFWFGIWIVWNVGVIPIITPFDPFPFGLLTMIVSLEAIFLSLFVLISQDRQARRDRIRNDIEYETNIRAEVEIRTLATQVEMLQQIMLQHLADLKNLQSAPRRKSTPRKVTPPEHGKMEDV
jgi:uncharacterized membrane protein